MINEGTVFVAAMIGFILGALLSLVIIVNGSVWQYGSCMRNMTEDPEIITLRQTEALCSLMHPR